MKKSLLLLFFALCLPLAGCGDKNDDTTNGDTRETKDTLKTGSTEAEFPPGIVAKFDSIINDAILEDSIPGIIGGIWIPGKGNYTFVKGEADLKTGQQRKMTDHIRIGSITKTFVATVVLMLCDEGKMGLNDRLNKYVPKVPNSENITIRELLDMTSGLQDYLNAPVLENAFFYNRDRKFTDEEILDIAIKLPPVFPPGEPDKWHYSNTNYLLLGMIIEKVTGESWQQGVRNKILLASPVFRNTSVPADVNMPVEYSHGYMRDSTGNVIDVTDIDPSITGAAGCMISDIEDLKYWVSVLVKGELLSDTMQAERMKLVPTGQKEFLKYGLGIFSADGFAGHNGGITGYNTSMYYDKDRDAMFVLNVNMFGPIGGVSDKIFMELSAAIYGSEVPWGEQEGN